MIFNLGEGPQTNKKHLERCALPIYRYTQKRHMETPLQAESPNVDGTIVQRPAEQIEDIGKPTPMQLTSGGNLISPMARFQHNAYPRCATEMQYNYKKSKYKQKLPTRKDLERYQSQRVPEKTRCPQSRRLYSPANAKNPYMIPRTTLFKSNSGLNTGSNWFKKSKPLPDDKLRSPKRLENKPWNYNTWKHVHPAKGPIDERPSTAHVFTASNAFHRSTNGYFKNKEQWPEDSPEITEVWLNNHKRVDRHVVYREEMLKLADMMEAQWKKKK